MDPVKVLVVANSLLPVVILARGLRTRLPRVFPAFHVYLAVSSISTASLFVLMQVKGVLSSEYATAWRVTTAISQLAEFVAVLELLRFLGGLKSSVLPLIVLTSVLGVFTAAGLLEGHPIPKQLAMGSAVELGAWAALLYYLLRNRDIYLGPNVTGIFRGLCAMFGLQWIIVANYMQGFLSYETFGILATGTTAGVYLVFLFALWNNELAVELR